MASIQAIFDSALDLHRKGKWDEAEAAYRKVLEGDAHHADAHNNLALLLKRRREFVEAETAYRNAITARPETPETLNNLGVLYLETNRLDEAETAFRQAVGLRSDYPEAWNNIGNLLQGQRRYPEAEQAYQSVITTAPVRIRNWLSHAQALAGQDRKEEAGRLQSQAKAMRSTLAEAFWNLALLYLLQGRYAEGWPLHEARYDPARFSPVPLPPKLPCPQWHGEPLKNKAILVWFEQGLGDEVQFARYIPWLKAQGARHVTLVCKTPLVELLKTVSGVDLVLPAEGQLVMPPPNYWVFPMSLPLYHGTTIDNIPTALPYLSASQTRVAHWAKKLPKRTRKVRHLVGLIWAGSMTHRNDANRSLPGPEVLAPLWKLSETAFISLQKGDREGDMAYLSPKTPLLHLGDEIQDLADTAAIISQLDLLICVDTVAAHIAGAMNKPCWVMLPWMGVDWRWLLDREDSPWYPGALRLFRQPALGDWASVVKNMASAFQTMHPTKKPVSDRKK